MLSYHFSTSIAVSLAIFSSNAAAQSDKPIEVLCSWEVETCEVLKGGFELVTGKKVSITRRGSGDALNLLRSNKAKPLFDVWYGGTGDPHLLAAEENLTETYKSENLKNLHPWALKQAELSAYKTTGIYAGLLGIVYNTNELATKKLPPPKCWRDLTNPIYRGHISMADPRRSGTAYMAISLWSSLFGEQYQANVEKISANILEYPSSGTAPLKKVLAGESAISISFLHDAAALIKRAEPLKIVVPCEGTTFEIGSVSLIQNRPNQDGGKIFFDWTLTRGAARLARESGSMQTPAHKEAGASVLLPDISKIALADYDYKRFGSPAVRKQLLEQWEILAKPDAKNAQAAKPGAIPGKERPREVKK